MKPLTTLTYLLIVFALTLGLMAVFPKEGIHIGDKVHLQFPTLAEFLYPDTSRKVDIDAVIAELNDSTPEVDSLALMAEEERVKDSLRRARRRIQFAEDDASPLFPFFAAMEALSKDKQAARVLHFGDSQIEGDRMTSLIRARLQEKFGGSGPGLSSLTPLVPSMSLKVESSPEWKRFPGFGRRDTSVKHSRYGVLASFSRFAPVSNDSLPQDSIEYSGYVKLIRSGAAFNKSKRYERLRLFMGYNRKPVNLTILSDGNLLAKDSIPAGNFMRVKRYDFPPTPKELHLIFSGKDSPDIYGASLESATGLQVDNVSMRGASGTSFGSWSSSLLRQCFDSLNVKLLILQFGGNTVPYIKDSAHAERYAKSFANQIRLLKRLAPEASVIVIGPADMAVNEKGKMVTHPQLEHVRNAMLRTVQAEKAGYFDVYEVMGGRNSMDSWVNADPPLAARDYVHFSPGGARKIAEVFVQELFKLYDQYKKAVSYTHLTLPTIYSV